MGVGWAAGRAFRDTDISKAGIAVLRKLRVMVLVVMGRQTSNVKKQFILATYTT